MRRLLFVSATSLLAFCHVLALDPAQKISYETRAARLPVIFASLSKELNTKLAVDPMFAREVLAIRVKDVAAQDLLDRIATVLGAEWVESTVGLTLDRKSEMQATVKQKDIDGVIAFIKTEIDKAKKNPDQMGGPGQFMASMMRSDVSAEALVPADTSGDPERKALMAKYGEITKRIRISSLDMIDPQVIGNLMIGGRIVWSNKPNSKQKPLPIEFVKAIEQANREITLIRNEMTRLDDLAVEKAIKEKKANPQPTTTAAQEEMMGEDDYPIFAPYILPIEKVQIIAERPLPYSYQINVKSANDSIAYVSADLEGNRFAMMMEAIEAMNPNAGGGPPKPKYVPTITLKDPKKLVPQTETSKMIQEISAKFSGGPGETPDMDALSEGIQKIRVAFLKPDEVDPLSNASTQALFAIAEDQNANLVSYLPDSAFNMEGMGPATTQMTNATALKSLENLGTLDLESNGGWVVGKSRYPSISPSVRLDRIMARKLAEQDSANGSIDLMTRVAFAQTYPDYSPDMLNGLQFMIFPSLLGESGMMGGGTAFHGLRFYGSLDPNQRNTLHSGNPLPFRALGGSQQMLYLACLTSFEDLERTPINRGGMFDFLNSMGEEEQMNPADPNAEDTSPREAPFKDRSEAEPFLLNDGYAQGSFAEEKVISPVKTKVEIFPLREMSAQTYASILAMKTSKSFKEMAAFFPKFESGFYYGTRTNLNMSFVVKGFGARQSVSDSRMDKTIYQENNLPSEFMTEVKKFYEKMLKAVEKMDSYREEPPAP